MPRPSAPAGEEWDWDRLRALAERWYRPLIEREGWLALAYLFLGMLTGLVFCGVMFGALWINFGLLFIGVGFLLIGLFFRLVEALTGVERRLAGIVGEEIPPRPIKPIKGIGIKAVLDGERWRQVGFLAINGVLGVLTQRRRDGLTKQVEGFVAGIGKRINDRIDEFGTDRAELRWDENGIRYRIVLRKEDDEWRVDDIYIRPAPKEDETEKGGIEGGIPDDF